MLNALALIRRLAHAIASISLAGIVLAYSYEVLVRYALGAPTGWSAELVSYLLCILVFTMFPTVTAQRGHVAVTVLLEQFGRAKRVRIERVITILGVITCLTVCLFAAQESWRQFSRGVAMMATYPIPKWWISIWLAIGFGLAALEYLRLAVLPHSSDATDDSQPLTITPAS
ncbi:MAG: TRAP transporter small permease [Burkholderiaceae bacterium]